MIDQQADITRITSMPNAAAGELLANEDAVARERALDPATSFIVQAPAGSGKTELLTQRVLRLLATVDAPEEIVALTFTRKAAREMRERIGGALKLALGEEPKEDHRRLTWRLAGAALARDAEMEWNLLEYPGRLRVMTIDSLCQSIARQMPIVSRFGAVPDITEDAELLYRETARELLKSLDSDAPWVDALEHLLMHLDNDHPQVEELIVQMLGRRDQWLRHVLRVGSNGAVDANAIRADLERGLENAVVDALRAARATMSDRECAEIVALAAQAGANLQSEGVESAICACCGIDRLDADSHEALPVWQGIAEMLLTKENAWRKSVNKGQGFHTKEPMRDRIRFLLEGMHADNETSVRDAIARVRALPSARYTDDQWQTVLALVDVLKASVGFLQTTFQLNGAIDFAGISMAARHALGTDENPTDLALSLDYRIRHLLVDEFQDTSHGQFDLLGRLTAGWTDGDGRTVFAVGDPMQSIYRFREAEVGLFLQAREGGIGSIRLTPLTLGINFRSQPGIVEWVNETFAQIFPAENDIGSGAVRYTASAPAATRPREAGDAVRVSPLIVRDDEAEAAEVSTIIQRERAIDSNASIAILVRGRKHLESIVAQLNRDGIRFQAVDIDRLRDRPVVSDLLSLTRAILHPADRIAWLAVLRAPWCGLTLADLTTITADGSDATVWSLLNDADRVAQLSDDARARVVRFRDVMRAVHDDRRRRSLRRAVQGAWNALGGPACVERENDLRDAMRLFELLDAHESGADVLDIASLEKDAKELFASPDMSATNLQIMTVHKSKGLEFDVVILPGLGRGGGRDAADLLLFAERPHAQEVNLLVAPIKSSTEAKDPLYSFLKDFGRDKSNHEERRVLYVAATRARRRLYLLGHASIKRDDISPARGSLLSHLWPVVSPLYGELANQLAGADANLTADDQLMATALRPITRLVSAWTLPVVPRDAEWDRSVLEVESEDVDAAAALSRTWAAARTRHIGTAVHRMLCRIARDGAGKWNAARVDERRESIRAVLGTLGIADDELGAAVDSVVDAVTRTLEDEKGRWILSSAHEASANELAVTGLVDGGVRSVRIDRTFIDSDGVRWIIDYKAGMHEGADREGYLKWAKTTYAPQLERYVQLMSALDPEHDVRCGLYFPRIGAWLEW